MWSIVKGWVTGNFSLPIGFFLVLFGIILVVLLPNLSSIEEKLGFKTKAQLEREVSQQQISLNQAGQANANLKKESDNQQQLGNVKVDTVVTVNESKKTNETVVGTIIKKKDQVIQGVKKKFTPQTPESEKSKEIATVQINAVWDAYCQFNTDTQCPIPKLAS